MGNNAVELVIRDAQFYNCGPRDLALWVWDKILIRLKEFLGDPV